MDVLEVLFSLLFSVSFLVDVYVAKIMMFSIASNLHSPSFLTEAIGSIGRLFFDTGIVDLFSSPGAELTFSEL